MTERKTGTGKRKVPLPPATSTVSAPDERDDDNDGDDDDDDEEDMSFVAAESASAKLPSLPPVKATVVKKAKALTAQQMAEAKKLIGSSKKAGNSTELFKCPYCPLTCKRNQNFVDHLRIHTGEKPFVCSSCGKAFARSGNLKRHVRIHLAVKPFQCRVCPKGFCDKSNLQVHLRSVHRYSAADAKQISRYTYERGTTTSASIAPAHLLAARLLSIDPATLPQFLQMQQAQAVKMQPGQAPGAAAQPGTIPPVPAQFLPGAMAGGSTKMPVFSKMPSLEELVARLPNLDNAQEFLANAKARRQSNSQGDDDDEDEDA